MQGDGRVFSALCGGQAGERVAVPFSDAKTRCRHAMLFRHQPIS